MFVGLLTLLRRVFLVTRVCSGILVAIYCVFFQINSYAPGLLDKVKAYSIEAWEQMKQNALILWQFFLRYSYMALEWVKANVFV
jgi:hypothetical protein